MRKLSNETKAQILAKFDAEKAEGRGHGLTNRLAKEYGVSRWTIQEITANRERFSKYLDDFGGVVAGRSVLYDAEGKVKLQWVKSKQETSDAVIKELIQTLCERIPSREPIPAPNSPHATEDLLACYPMGDPHFGMYSWEEETGNDFDLKIAERDLLAAVSRLVDTAPPCREALIVNLGDFFHADNTLGETMRSKHKLDTDSRWFKVLQVGLDAMITCVEMALKKHERVTVICAIGNHDDHSAMMLMHMLFRLFRDEPRVTILDAPTIKHYFRFGEVLIGVHHGHSIKMERLPFQMANDRAEDWGETRHRYWLTGHIHHDARKEYDGVIVESFRTLAGRDAWAASQGYKSGRDMKCILFHRRFGEVERHTVSVEMLNAIRG